MIDVATLHQVAVALGGTRGDEIKTSADGRIFISQSHQVDVLNPIQPPHVASTNPPPQGIVSLPLGTVSVTFDEDMFVGDPTNPHAVVNPANYQLAGDNSGMVTITSVTYSASTRTALLEFNNPNADHYTLKVLTGVENTAGLQLAQVYTTDFQAVSDFSPFVNISFTDTPAFIV